ncbi:hypothetical protein WDZ17_17195 [Pseudokineococcus basanitobsidens]|uniref:Polyketide cyclase/dehydrase/lipid transport protein n=1 Tax=Pseudokineococcus basanitobsidens TaxID=1926649 RepID=A0ABU8RPP5_9ACTN
MPSAPGAARSLVDAVRGVAEKAAAAVGHRSPPVQQTLTVGRPPEEVAALWRDPAAVRQVLGDVGTVVVDRGAGAHGDRWTWRLVRPGSDEPVQWRTALADGGVPRTLRWADPDEGSERPAELVVVLRDAPQGLGTEQVVRLDLPVPGLAAGAAALMLGYRARALLLTGEVPTMTPQPAGRGRAR